MILTRLALKPSLRLVGWAPAAWCAAAVAGLLALYATVWQGASWPVEVAFLAVGRVVETILPLAVGMHIAFLLSPEDEESLELLLASPRPLAWVLLERLAVVVVLQGSVGLIGSLAIQGIAGGESFLLLTARWVAPSVFVGGVALWMSLASRKGVLSALVTLLLWGGLLMGSRGLERIFFSWPIQVFMQPESVGYARNRLALTLIGLGLAALAARLTADEERMLGLRQAGSADWGHWLKMKWRAR